MSAPVLHPLVKSGTRVILIAVIAAAHVWALFLLYPRVNSDFIRFLLPTGIALILYFIVLPRKHPVWPIVALALMFLSLWGGMFAALNTYGS